MKISFAITVCNELEEIKKLVLFLFKHKRKEDEIVILYDEKNGNPEILDFLLPYNKFPHVQTWRGFDFEGNFADWKNILNDYCDGDYIYQLDADEMISEYMIKNLHEILEMNSNVDLIFVPRINTVNGITQEHIDKWGWRLNEKGWVNFPDYQTRIYRRTSEIEWQGNVHERIVGYNTLSVLPQEEEYCLYHHKQIERQEKQNAYYDTI